VASGNNAKTAVERNENGVDVQVLEDENVSEEEEEEENDPNAISLNVKGTDDKTLKVKISNKASVFDLKSKLASLTEFGVDRQRLIFLGRMLTDNMKLVDYKIKDGNFIHLVPKPAGLSQQSNSQSSNSDSRNHLGLTEENIILPSDLSMFRNPTGSFPRRGHDFDIGNDDYMRRLELGLWRARVRLLSSLCLFYYFLEFMNILAFWMHPEEADQRFEHGHHPSNLYYSLDTVENLWGIVVSLKGLKTAAEDSTILSKSFLRDVVKLCVVHFINLAIWCQEVADGRIKEIRVHAGKPKPQEDADVGMAISFSIMINILIWLTIIAISARYHKELSALHGEEVESTTESGDARVEDSESSTEAHEAITIR